MPALTVQQRHERRVAQLRAEVAQAIAEGRLSLSVRQMTPEERVACDGRREAIRTSAVRPRRSQRSST